MNAFTIKDIENLSGIKAHTIRIWELRYSLIKPQRTGTNIRYYSNEELKKILNVALLNKFGYKISHIDKMNDDEINRHIMNLSLQDAKQERIINDLLACMIDLEIDKFEESLNESILVKGIEHTITEVIFPFLEKIGILWLTNHINPAQEHLVTNIIRQKLVAGIEGVITRPNPSPVALLFLPEGEHHELGLLYVHYLLKKRGVKVLYLGADVPFSDLGYIVQLKSPAYLYTHLTSVASNFNGEKFFRNLNSHSHETPVIVSGAITHNYKKPVPANVHLKKSLAEVMDDLLQFS
jgi:DNA-binding transcriptional MerR regulator